MVHFITGEVNSGKTTRLVSLYQAGGCGDGFFCGKIMVQGMYAGQRIIRLSTGESRLFSLREAFLPPKWSEECAFGGYSFSADGLSFARCILEDVRSRKVTPVFVDEVGPLELAGQGLHAAFAAILAAGAEVYVVVRKRMLEDVRAAYHLDAADVIEV